MIMSEAVTRSLTDVFKRQTGFTPLQASSVVPSALVATEDLYSIGLADGQVLADTAFSVERQQLKQLLASANAIRPEDNAGLGMLVGDVVRQIVHKIIGDTPVDPEFLKRQIALAIDVLDEADAGRAICMNPADLALFSDADLPLPCKPDATLAVGSIRIECADGWIDHGRAFALQRLDTALGNKSDLR